MIKQTGLGEVKKRIYLATLREKLGFQAKEFAARSATGTATPIVQLGEIFIPNWGEHDIGGHVRLVESVACSLTTDCVVVMSFLNIVGMAKETNFYYFACGKNGWEETTKDDPRVIAALDTVRAISSFLESEKTTFQEINDSHDRPYICGDNLEYDGLILESAHNEAHNAYGYPMGMTWQEAAENDVTIHISYYGQPYI